MMKFVFALCLVFLAGTSAFVFDESYCASGNYPCTFDMREYCFVDGHAVQGCDSAYAYLCQHPTMAYSTC